MQKSLNMKAFFYLTITLIFLSCSSPAQKDTRDKKMEEILLLDKNDFNPYVEFYSTDIKDYFNPESSGKYPSTNLFDGFLKTCWIAGSVKKDSASALYIKIPEQIPVSKLILNIFSGYGKSKVLYNKNARPKKIKISTFSALGSDANSTEVADAFFIKEYTASTTINLVDTFGIQSFSLQLNADSILQYQQKILKEYHTFSKQQKDSALILSENNSLISSIILKLEIEESYKGTKYDDICVSEIFFNDRFVTAYPDKYKPISDVYINNDNTLLTDYADKKGVIVLQDTSSIFTMADWPVNSNWAILHYVPNDTEGENSRTEEQYLLIDLKNQQPVINDLERCTGIILSSPVIDKDENNRLFIDNFDKYKVELK